MPKIELAIVMDEAGRVAVSGPIDQTALCYGLLEVAKDAIRTHAEQARNRLVQPAPPGLVLESPFSKGS